MSHELMELLSGMEDLALQELTNAITIDVNMRLPRLMRRLRINKTLDFCDIRIVGVSFQIDVDEETRQMLIDKKNSLEDEKNKEFPPDYYG